MQKILTYDLPNIAATERLARQIALILEPPLTLGLSGQIGAGKTTFIRAVLKALGITTVVKSPSYSLVETYLVNNLKIHHFDLYRIRDESELEYIGFRDFFADNAICCIEWPEYSKNCLDKLDVHFNIDVLQGEARQVTIRAYTLQGSKFLANWR